MAEKSKRPVVAVGRDAGSGSAAVLTPEAARALTDEVKAAAHELWVKLLRLYEEGAHAALGYSSWEAYCEAEFDMRSSQAYRLLDSGRVIAALNDSPIGERPASESVARELVPVLRDEPERVEEVWADVVQEHGPRPSAKQTRDVVTRRKPAERSEWHRNRRHLDSNRMLTVLAQEMDALTAGLELMNPEQLDPNVIAECLPVIRRGMRVISSHLRRIGVPEGSATHAQVVNLQQRKDER